MTVATVSSQIVGEPSDYVFVGLGGNLGTEAEIRERFASACDVLATQASRDGTVVRSPIYRTAPRGPVRDQPDFLNMVIAFRPRAALSPRDVLSQLLAIEAAHGRVRDRDMPKGPRTLDLDLLLFLDRVLCEPDLQVPHPRLGHRAFVLRPLLDLLGQPATLAAP